MKTDADRLRAAKALVERGWCQGYFHCYAEDGRSQYCVVGAIRAVSGSDGSSTQLHCFRKAIGAESIGDWNDTPGRTQAAVLDAFSRAIELAEATP